MPLFTIPVIVIQIHLTSETRCNTVSLRQGDKANGKRPTERKTSCSNQRVSRRRELGDVWTFCAIDAENKLVPAFKVGKRDHATANAFVSDVASRLRNRPQVSTDGLRAYPEAVENAFGVNVDYGMIIKNYGADTGEHHQERRYSAPTITFCEKREVTGHPDMDLICTSHVERLNATTRLHMRRLTRLTHAFSKKIEYFEAAVALHFAYYNLVRTHGSLKMTPAMFAGVEKDFWMVADLVKAAL